MTYRSVWLIGCVCLLSSVVYAADGDDCASARSSSVPTRYQKIYSLADAKIAQQHLLAYCCNEKKVSGDDCFSGKVPLPVYLESPYWYDHLVDVGFRKLDVVGAYGTVDPMAQAWKDLLLKETKPDLIQAAYAKYWTLSPSMATLATMESSFSTVSSGSLEGYSLGDRYLAVCLVSSLIYQELLSTAKIPLGSTYDTLQPFGRCVALAKQRSAQELAYAKIMMVNSSTSLLTKSVNSYLSEEFVQGRLMKLLDTLVNINQLFAILAKQAPLSKSCSKK